MTSHRKTAFDRYFETRMKDPALVDVPAAADIHAVLAALQRGDEEGRWHFAESHCGHPKE